jgi:hypothetical protein
MHVSYVSLHSLGIVCPAFVCLYLHVNAVQCQAVCPACYNLLARALGYSRLPVRAALRNAVVEVPCSTSGTLFSYLGSSHLESSATQHEKTTVSCCVLRMWCICQCKAVHKKVF